MEMKTRRPALSPSLSLSLSLISFFVSILFGVDSFQLSLPLGRSLSTMISNELVSHRLVVVPVLALFILPPFFFFRFVSSSQRIKCR